MVALLAIAAAAAIAVAVSGGGSPRARRQVAATTHAAPAPARIPASAIPVTTRKPVRPHHPLPDPGSLPQTHVRPSSRGTRFRSVIGALWAGIVTGRLGPALPAFFPGGHTCS